MDIIIELGNNISAPLAGTILGNLGFEVIKVEPPLGDERRKVEPSIKGISVYFASTNSYKKSIVIDLKSEKGREIFYNLIKKSKAIITNYRPSALKRLMIDYESVRKFNPKIVYCSITGFGNFSRFANKAAYDATIMALSGLMDLTGEENGPPVKFATSIVDITTALMATIATLYGVNKGGPLFIDVPMLMTQFFLTLEDAYYYLNLNVIPKRTGSSHRYVVPYQAFKVKDGYLFVAAFTEEQYANLCRALGREDLMKFNSKEERVKNREYINNAIQEILINEGKDYWEEILSKSDVPVAPILTLDEAFKRFGEGIVREVEGIKYVGFPITFIPSENRKINGRAPRLGEHTKEVLSSIGYSEDEINKLKLEGVISEWNDG
jgi:crotonobetainyl-CoA:carnitine CoA-transferase CaiB-like acyl-CoA transferase